MPCTRNQNFFNTFRPVEGRFPDHVRGLRALQAVDGRHGHATQVLPLDPRGDRAVLHQDAQGGAAVPLDSGGVERDRQAQEVPALRETEHEDPVGGAPVSDEDGGGGERWLRRENVVDGGERTAAREHLVGEMFF